jgi:glucan phosphoethanolaminetransferase (alkaline phosphatase superfamily)
VVRWHGLIPPRSGWLRLLTSPTSYLLTSSFVATLLAKAAVLRGLEDVGAWPLWLPGILAVDGLCFFGLAALLAAGEKSGRWVFFATVPLAILATAIALINAAHLGITGEQLTWEAVSLGLDRLGDLGAILAEQKHHANVLVGAAALAFAAVIPVARLARSRDDEATRTAAALARVHCASSVAAASALVWLLWPGSESPSVQRLRGNAALQTYAEWVMGHETSPESAPRFQRHGPRSLVDDAEVYALSTRNRPHVLIVVLESARFDHTSLAGEAARADTPHLLALARTGLHAPTTRAVVPHTTKSLFSILCGRLPLLQLTNLEISEDLDVECLPMLLARAGYRTGFFQSAVGQFEDRPRLVRQLGFEHFEAWEDIGGEPLGYLASDDHSLVAAVSRWIDGMEKPREPFIAVVLTSAAHHPYRLPSDVADRSRLDGSPMESDAERYARLMESADRMLGSLVQELAERRLREDTIIIVAGDHGEGFGAKGVRQHDNNFYEEGLRVPLVFAGPGVPTDEVEGNASLVDLTPTVLELLGVTLTTDAADDNFGQSLLGASPSGPRWFACWYPKHCQGFVEGSDKILHIPGSETLRFDLLTDPQEHHPRPPTPEQEARLTHLHRVVRAHQAPRQRPMLGEVTGYGRWQCAPGKPCVHPESSQDHHEAPH